MISANKLYLKLYSDIHDILLNQWDPIGVADIVEAEDEYNAYIPKIIDMLRSPCNKEDLFKYLRWLETEYIGLEGEIDTTRNVSIALWELKSRK